MKQASILLLILLSAGCATNTGNAGAADTSNSVYIYGFVAHPGVYPLKDGRTTSLDILTAAGGTSTGGDATIEITHVLLTNRLERKTVFNSIAALKTQPDADVELRPHDLIYVH